MRLSEYEETKTTKWLSPLHTHPRLVLILDTTDVGNIVNYFIQIDLNKLSTIPVLHPCTEQISSGIPVQYRSELYMYAINQVNVLYAHQFLFNPPFWFISTSYCTVV